MTTRRLVIVLALVLAAVAPAACAADESQPPLDTAASSPEDTVRAFYDWYTDYIGDRAAPRNPMVDRAYRDSPYLTDDFEARTDALLDGFMGGGFDPFVCAQDVPTSFDLDPAVTSNGAAAVTVHTEWTGHSFEVRLVDVDGGWLIDDVVCRSPEPQ